MRLLQGARGPCLAILAGLLSGAGAHAQITLVNDQQFLPDDSYVGNVGFVETLERAQTFTVGFTGLLIEVSVRILQQQEGDLFFHLLPTHNSVPVEDLGQALASRTIASGTVPATADYFTIDLSASRVEVTEGQVLALVLGANTPDGGYSWFGQVDGTYADGAAFERFLPSGTWAPSEGLDEEPIDLGFATVVAPPVYYHVTWPRDTAGCDDVNDLEACILTGAASGATIEIAADAVPAQSVFVSPGKSFTLRPAPGFTPVFGDFTSIVAEGGDQDVSIVIEGLTFESGAIRARHAGAGTFDVIIRGNEVQQAASNNDAIQVTSGNTQPPYGPTHFVVEDNDVEIDVDEFASVSAIAISGFQGSGNVGAVRGNRIHQIGGGQNDAIAIANGSVTLEVDVEGNQISGTAFDSGIFVFQFAEGGSTTARIVNNVISAPAGMPGATTGVSLDVTGGAGDLTVVNNTVAFNENGLRLQGLPTALINALIANNILAFNSEVGISLPEFGTTTNEFNLVFGSDFNFFTPGLGTLTVDPFFVSMGDVSLQPGSPARNAGSNARVPAGVVEDVLGGPRIVDDVVDMGAFEVPEPSQAAAALGAVLALASVRARASRDGRAGSTATACRLRGDSRPGTTFHGGEDRLVHSRARHRRSRRDAGGAGEIEQGQLISDR